MHMTQKFTWFKTILLGLSVTIGGGIAHYFFSPQQGPIYEYNEQRDAAAIKELFYGNWYWLTTREGDPGYIDFILKNRAPNEYDTQYYGKLNIKVLRENNELIGFVAYYMKNFYEGQLLFLVVKPEFRGKQYGEKLSRYAVNRMFAAGAKRIWLVTRTDNTKAQALYNRFGFKETSRPQDDYEGRRFQRYGYRCFTPIL